MGSPALLVSSNAIYCLSSHCMHGELPRRVLSRELAIPALDFIFFPGTTQKSGIGQEDGAKTDTNIFRCLPFSRKFPRMQ